MPRNVIVFIESNVTTGRLFLQTSRKLGLDPIVLARVPGSYHYIVEEGFNAIAVDTDDISAIMKAGAH